MGSAKDEIERLAISIEDTSIKISELWEQAKDHCSNSGYGFYCKLQIGLTELYSGLEKFLKDKCKHPRGVIEHLFNRLIEIVGGGEIHARARRL